jgi:hypothetical protein
MGKVAVVWAAHYTAHGIFLDPFRNGDGKIIRLKIINKNKEFLDNVLARRRNIGAAILETNAGIIIKDNSSFSIHIRGKARITYS